MAKQKSSDSAITISQIRETAIELKLEGTAPYMQAKFSEKAKRLMRDKMEQGSTAKKGTKREPRDFDADYQGAMHISEDGWNGIPCSAFRSACIDVCRMVGFKMTHAKMSVFIMPDGTDKDSGEPLVRIHGEPEMNVMATRNATGVADLRARPMWRQWSVDLRVKFDEDQFTPSDVVNLVHRAGVQVGVGEGRPFSKSSNGIGFGTFRVVTGPAKSKAKG